VRVPLCRALCHVEWFGVERVHLRREVGTRWERAISVCTVKTEMSGKRRDRRNQGKTKSEVRINKGRKRAGNSETRPHSGWPVQASGGQPTPDLPLLLVKG
jgi:hypothetical protein